MTIEKSNYRDSVSSLIAEALKKPSMFFRELSDLEMILHGHWVAYYEIARISRDYAFNLRFALWLWEQKGESGSAGWARAVVAIAEKRDASQLIVLEELVQEFLPTWQ